MKKVKVGEKECKFDKKKHKYYVDGAEVPGTTTITGIIDKSDPIKWWALNCARDYIENNLRLSKEYDEVERKNLAQGARLAHRKASSDAATIGSVVHEFAENWIKAKINDTPMPDFPHNEKAQISANQFLDWVGENEIEFLESEQMVYNPEFHYAGTYDAKARIDDLLLILDFKTSKDIYPEHFLQVVAYMEAEKIRTREEIDGVGILQFPKNSAGFQSKLILEKQELDQHFETFKACRKILNWQQNVV